MGIIYKVVLKTDRNTIYIGQTTLSLEDRKNQHETNRGTNLKQDDFDTILLRKGTDNWDWSIIGSNIPDDELASFEIHYIKSHIKNGYRLLNKHPSYEYN
jgi:hypothetical protein